MIVNRREINHCPCFGLVVAMLATLVHGATDGDWKFFSAPAAPIQAVGEIHNDGIPEIILPSEKSVGWWEKRMPCKFGKAIRFRIEAEITLEPDANPGPDVAFIVSWHRPGGDAYQTDYLDYVDRREGGKTIRLFGNTIPVPPECTEMSLHPLMRWRRGRMLLCKTETVETDVPRPRIARVAIANPRRGKTFMSIEDRLVQVEIALTNLFANVERPDIVMACSEVFAESLAPPNVAESAVGGPTFALLSRYAKMHRCWMAGGLRERAVDGAIYNSAILVDRQGHLAGLYRKTHLTYVEIHDGIMPGIDYPVFETEFGKVGFLICWDNYFPEAIRQLHLKGAELVIFPIAATGEGRFNTVFSARIYDTGIPMAISVRQGPRPSRILGHGGETLAETSEDNGYCFADIDLSYRNRIKWLSVDGLGAPYQLHRAERRPSTYSKEL